MNSSTRPFARLARCLAAVGVLTTPCCLQAQEPGRLEHELVAELPELPEPDLKRFFLQCERTVSQGSIGSADIRLCSLAYETLLQSSFGGDFLALLAWWRNELKDHASARAAGHP